MAMPEKSLLRSSSNSPTLNVKLSPTLKIMARRSPNACLPKPGVKYRRISLGASLETKHTANIFTNSATGLAARLRIDRDHWRTRSLLLESQLHAADRRSSANQRSIMALSILNMELQTSFDNVLATAKMRHADWSEMCSKQKRLVELVSDCENTIAKLRKSDRMKGKVHQRNLRLKAQLGAHVCEKKRDRDDERTLLEALAAANERIEELETAGEKLLDALDREDESDSSEEKDDESTRIGLLEAETLFRGVLEHQSIREEKSLWGDTLEP